MFSDGQPICTAFLFNRGHHAVQTVNGGLVKGSVVENTYSTLGRNEVLIKFH